MENSGGKKRLAKKGIALVTGASIALSMTPASFAVDNDTSDPQITTWSTLYSGLGVDTAAGYDAVTSATNFTGYHAKDIPAIVHKTAIGESTALDGVTVTDGVLDGTDQAESGSFVYTSNYGSLGEFDIVPYAADKEGYVWNDYIAGLYAATISDGTTTVGAVPWVDYYGEPAVSGPHFNKVQIALNNGTSKASNKADVARYSAFLDENGNMKAGTYTVTLYSEGFNKVTSDITVLETFSGDITANDVTKTASEITVSGLPEDIRNASATVTYSYQKEGDRRPTTVTVASGVAVDNGKITLEEGALSELTGKTLTVAVNSDNYAPMTAACTVTAFEDVKSSAYYYPAVAWAVEKGITTGTSETTFSPDESCTRAQVVTFLYRAAGEPSVNSTDKFTDVKAGSYYADAVAWAVENGITTGASATTFNPKGICDRAQIVTFLHRAAGEICVASTDKFTDVKEGSYYAEAVAWAVEQNITTGVSETEFAPKKDCTRAEVVTFLYRYFSSLS